MRFSTVIGAWGLALALGGGWLCISNPSWKAAAQQIALSGSSNTTVFNKAHAAALTKLRDPASSQFQDGLIININGNNIVCSRVNSKNGFGGYSGYAPFLYNEGSDSILMDNSEDGQFTIKQWCTKTKMDEWQKRLDRAKAETAKFKSSDAVPPYLQKEVNEIEREWASIEAWMKSTQ